MKTHEFVVFLLLAVLMIVVSGCSARDPASLKARQDFMLKCIEVYRGAGHSDDDIVSDCEHAARHL